jgi:SAM-dependent methyltransferase
VTTKRGVNVKEDYDARFYSWVNLTARRSASLLLPVVIDHCRPKSVLDVGCGQGAWLAVWEELGVADYVGLDGPHVDQAALAIPQERFRAIDLTKRWHLGTRYDLVQSIEVGEHLPASSAEIFVNCLCEHSDLVLFSAAQPGQGGERHINERNPSAWAAQFASRGYQAYDFIRPAVAKEATVDPWYRFNTVLYANAEGATRLDPRAVARRVTNLIELDNVGDFGWRLRRILLRRLPEPAVTALSRLRYRIAVTLHTNKA